MKKNLTTICLALLTVLTSNTNAAVLSVQEAFSLSQLVTYNALQSNSFALGSTLGTQDLTVSVDAFDSSLGTLTDVSINYAVDWRQQATVIGRNSHSNNQSQDLVDIRAQVSSHATFTLSLTDLGLVDVFTPSTASGCSRTRVRTALCSGQGTTTGSDTGMFDVHVGDIHSFISEISAPSVDFLVTNQQIAAVTQCSSTRNALEGTDLCRAIASGTVNGTISVDYTYDAAPVSVPAPSGLLGLMASIGLIAMARRRKTIVRG